MSGYDFRLAGYGEEEIALTSALLRLVFPHARHLTADYLRWMYRDNPDGPAIACNAWSEGALVGHMAAIPVCARVGGRDVTGMIIQNGAIHPAHRGRRLQSAISEAMFDEGLRQGRGFCLAIGNRSSTGPLSTRFQMLRPLEARLGVGALRRRRASPEPSFARVWTPDRLAWRLRNPARRYSVADGSVYAPTGWPGIAALLAQGAALADSGRRPLEPLRLYIGLDPAVDFARSFYLPIPARLRPSPLNLMWRSLDEGLAMPDPGGFVLRPIDLDAY
jgi:GNAT superfamily N-acetyltransferase